MSSESSMAPRSRTQVEKAMWGKREESLWPSIFASCLWPPELWSMVSKAAEISRRQRQETCWWEMAETSLLYKDVRRVSVECRLVKPDWWGLRRPRGPEASPCKHVEPAKEFLPPDDKINGVDSQNFWTRLRLQQQCTTRWPYTAPERVLYFANSKLHETTRNFWWATSI